MSLFWDRFYDTFKDRRYGALFLCALVFLLAGFAGLALLGVAFDGLGLESYWRDLLPGFGILMLAWGILKFRRAQTRSRARLLPSPLSRDELRVARSKLRNGMKSINRPAPRVPDTNLKY
ncbi:MAG TPA: hypothetical protein VMB80_05400 [Candidatus Acidoferrum sp.]|nr:hypothetical protein [Candidatus Acidoferrum sp.]